MSDFNISIYRDEHYSDRSLGELFVTGISGRFCYTLEDAIRAKGIKIWGETGVPAGKMRGKVTYSQRFKREMILLYNESEGVLVIDDVRFEGIRVHGGNRPRNTEGCPLVAHNRITDSTGKRIIYGSAEDDLTKYVKSQVGYNEFDVFIFNTCKNS